MPSIIRLSLLLTGVAVILNSTVADEHDPAATGNGMLVDHVWSGHPVSFGLLTDRGHQFVAYYDAQRRITIAGRRLDQSNWARVKPDGVYNERQERMSNVTGWDSHNYLTMALDRDGCLHVSGNVHADPLVYYRTAEPFDLSTLERIDRMTGEREERTTYPKFSRSPRGDLIFKYRDGGSGNGSDLYNLYDPDTRTWHRLFEGPLLEGEGERSAYGTGPRRGPDGRYHMLWMWRDTPDATTNHTLSYAQSPDLIAWQDSSGKPIPRPITMAAAEVIDDAKPGQGLVNMTYALGWDRDHRPVAVYHRYDEQGRSQIFIARPNGAGNWQTNQLSDWDFRWDFPGRGSQVKEITVGSPEPNADGNLVVPFWTKNYGSGRWLVDQNSLAVIDRRSSLPQDPVDNTNPISMPPRGNFPGLQVNTQTSDYEGNRWVLRWETLGTNRDMVHREVPPPSELRLYAK